MSYRFKECVYNPTSDKYMVMIMMNVKYPRNKGVFLTDRL